MGQLCCFPFSRDEEKISAKNGGEPDDAELLRLSKRLVENAVLKAVQQYLEETQSRGKPANGSSGKARAADRGGADGDQSGRFLLTSFGKKPIGLRDLIREALRRERMGLKSKVKQIKELLLKPETQARIRRELLEGRPASSRPGGDPGDQVLQAPPPQPEP